MRRVSNCRFQNVVKPGCNQFLQLSKCDAWRSFCLSKHPLHCAQWKVHLHPPQGTLSVFLSFLIIPLFVKIRIFRWFIFQELLLYSRWTVIFCLSLPLILKILSKHSKPVVILHVNTLVMSTVYGLRTLHTERFGRGVWNIGSTKSPPEFWFNYRLSYCRAGTLINHRGRFFGWELT